MGKRQKVLAFVLVGFMCTSLTFFGARADGAWVRSYDGASHVSKQVREFPLWSMVPSRSFAVLDEGIERQQRWGLYTFRGKGAHADQKPCIELVTLYFGSPGGGLSLQGSDGCGVLAPPAHQPVLVHGGITVSKTVKGPAVSDSIFGMTMALNVSSIRVELEPNVVRRFHTRLLSQAQARKARVRQFRYVSFGIAKEVCLAQVTAYDSRGVGLLETKRHKCS